MYLDENTGFQLSIQRKTFKYKATSALKYILFTELATTARSHSRFSSIEIIPPHL